MRRLIRRHMERNAELARRVKYLDAAEKVLDGTGLHVWLVGNDPRSASGIKVASEKEIRYVPLDSDLDKFRSTLVDLRSELVK